MRPIIPTRSFNLVEPIGVGTGLVEASSSLWKRAAERASVRFADLVRWAFDGWPAPPDYRHSVTAERMLPRRFWGIDGAGAVAKLYLGPLRSLVSSDSIEACTLLPFAGLLYEKALLHRHRAWCPMCLASMLLGPGVYEPLLWRIQAVKVCPVHRVDLVESCHVCRVPQQRVLAAVARVGCCNHCGAWLGAEEAVHRLQRADAGEVRVARAIMSLLAWTAEFDGRGHDGATTMRKLVAVTAARDLLISKFDVSPNTIRAYVSGSTLPRLSFLATVAAVSRQPLHRVILGQVVSWRTSSIPRSQENVSTGSLRRDWKSIEREFEKVARDPTCVNVKRACKLVNIGYSSARTYFPDLVAQIVERWKLCKKAKAAARDQALLVKMRNAFRMLVAADTYPSTTKIAKISGVSMLHLGADRVRGLLDEEWLRAEASTHWRRYRFRNTPCNRDHS